MGRFDRKAKGRSERNSTMISVIRFRIAMLFCIIAFLIFPKCKFQKELKNIMLEQGKNFRFNNINLGLSLKEQLKEQTNDR